MGKERAYPIVVVGQSLTIYPHIDPLRVLGLLAYTHDHKFVHSHLTTSLQLCDNPFNVKDIVVLVYKVRMKIYIED